MCGGWEYPDTNGGPNHCMVLQVMDQASISMAPYPQLLFSLKSSSLQLPSIPLCGFALHRSAKHSSIFFTFSFKIFASDSHIHYRGTRGCFFVYDLMPFWAPVYAYVFCMHARDLSFCLCLLFILFLREKHIYIYGSLNKSAHKDLRSQIHCYSSNRCDTDAYQSAHI
jgi:hypothetical protein